MVVSPFHIAIDGPSGTTFRAFPNTEIQGGDPAKTTLDMIRNKCSISNKYFFTTDGKNKIDDKTTLEYYMSLSTEGQAILEPSEKDKKVVEKTNGKPTEVAAATKSTESSVAGPGVSTINIKVTDGKTAEAPLALPVNNEAMSKLLAGISANSLQRGTLPTFADRDLASLASNYVTNASTTKYKEPEEMTEKDWNSVLVNNRAMHGYRHDFGKNILVKASKRAFKLKGVAPVGKPPADQVKEQIEAYHPPVPPFYIEDDATVDVTEVRNQWQHTLIQEGFSSFALGGSVGGGQQVPISISASYEKESSFAKTDRESTSVDSIAATYNFPRVVIELEPDDLELTDECRRDAINVTSDEAVKNFYRKYGTVFATSFALGGYLHSTRQVSTKEKSNLEQIKNTTRMAAGLSIQSPKISGSLNIAKVDSEGKENSTASLNQDVHLTWDAHGGDTLLCSNPPAWASTVKDHRLWRLMKQERVVDLQYLIKDIDTVAYAQLDHPTTTTRPSGNVLTDKPFNEEARRTLMMALQQPDRNAMALKIQKYYESNQLDVADKIAIYNKFIQDNFPKEKDAVIKESTKYGATDVDQRVGLGIYMVSKGELQM